MCAPMEVQGGGGGWRPGLIAVAAKRVGAGAQADQVSPDDRVAGSSEAWCELANSLVYWSWLLQARQQLGLVSELLNPRRLFRARESRNIFFGGIQLETIALDSAPGAVHPRPT